MFHVGIAGSMSEALIILAIYRVPVSVSGCFQALMSVGSVAIVSPMSASITADLFESIMSQAMSAQSEKTPQRKSNGVSFQ